MSALKPTTVKYSDDFVFDLNSQDIYAYRAVASSNGVLSGLPVNVTLTSLSNYEGVLGATSKLLYLYTTNGLAILNNGSACISLPINADKARKMSCFCKYREQVYFSYEDKPSYKVYPIKCEQISDSKFAAMCFVNDRFLGLINGLDLYLGENGEDVLNLEDKQNPVPYVTLPTYCQAMVPLGLNDVYLLGRTCYKLTVSADFSDVKLKRIATGLTTVNKWTVQVLGDKIVFATNNALYALCNDKVTRIMTEFDNVVSRDYSKCRASALNGKYVLSAERKNVRLAYVLDLDKRKCVCVLNEGILEVAEHDNHTYNVTDNGKLNAYDSLLFSDGTYSRSNVDFGEPARKFIRRLNVRTKGDLLIRITDEYGEKEYSVKGSDSEQSIPVVASGVNFSYKIVWGAKQMQLDKFELVADIYKGVEYGN